MAIKNPAVVFKKLLVLVFCLTGISSAQQSRMDIEQIVDSYNNINFEQTINLTSQAIKKAQSYSIAELITIYKYRAFAYFNTGNENSAGSAFRTLLSLDDKIELDSVTVSPKIISFFEKIKQNMLPTIESEKPIIEPTFIPIYDPRPDAAWRSLFLPGWGQYYKNEKPKSYLLLSAFTINSIGLLISFLQENAAHNDYLNAVTSSEINATYSRYNRWYKARHIFLYSEAAIWLYAFIDALWVPTARPAGDFTLQLQSKGLTLSYSF